ncbi:dihydropteroate synthase [Bordetella genomosp. 1]|uniref:Dihydropteroate synthase n=1 Tax=Bordetella genomosp. 1 TaxID=1395607 RepID=A0A261SPQ4_9BORD|nr:dihydropteroate synthase [Bordetella genomosp. 1]OZI39125.1 dihydropteroate synthase [Bordetella genomosp. 1]OZI65347.1 dihydropteroate synthase [Bordetella genomosp. 1]
MTHAALLPDHDPYAPVTWPLAHGRQLELGPRGIIMAVINVTPDSFSDGGRLASVAAAEHYALACLAEGAHILDVGGESTKPDAAEVSAAEEQDRVLPVIEALARITDALISVDTYRAETARLALAAGAHIVNDVHGLQREPAIAEVAAQARAGVVIMHTGRQREVLADPLADQFAFFDASLRIADAAGLSRAQLVLDPGFGFAKDPDCNLALMARLPQLQRYRLPILVGTSRKRFLGALTGRELGERDVATAISTSLLRDRGAAIARVHDVGKSRDALALTDALLRSERG